MNAKSVAIAWFALLFAGCGDDAKPKNSVFVPTNNSNNTANNSSNNSQSNNTNNANSNNSTQCDGGVCELDCSDFADPNFCWNQARSSVYSCMDDELRGTMNAAGIVCTAGDVSVEFAAEIDASALADIEDWDFRIVQNGETCARVVDEGEKLTLETQRGTVLFRVDQNEYRIECEDGAAWVTTDYEMLLTCADDDGILNIPGTTSFSAGPEFGFGLLPGSGSIFKCTFE